MGIYLNPGNENFKENVIADVYVDKSMMIAEVNKLVDSANKYICVSRPRRFGKTITTNMLSAYYSRGCDSEEIFGRLKIATYTGFEEKLNRYNVIKVDVNSEYQNTKEADRDDLIEILSDKIKGELKVEFPQVSLSDRDTLATSILKVYAETGHTLILLFDEYDVLVREKVGHVLFNKYLSFLNGLFKSDTVRPAISLAYITGILPVVRDKVQSKLNNFREYTILNARNLAEYIGFTQEEVQELCIQYNLNYEECRRWYDGYHQHGFEIYNPESVVCAIEDGMFLNYWSKTSTYRVISDMIAQNFEGVREDVIRMLAGESIDVNVTTYMNTMDSFMTKGDLFTYLIHIGYLAYDMTEGTCCIPNREIRQEWCNAIEVNDDYAVTNQIIQRSRELLNETIAGNAESVARALDISHIHVTSNRSYNNEDALQSAIYLAYIYALNKYTIVKEMTAGKGFSDVTFIPFEKGYPAMIVELKRNDSVTSAISQIKDKQYYESLSHYQGELLFVGINYDEKDKTHTCSIEKMEKA